MPSYCDNDWGKAWDYRIEVGGMLLLLGIVPSALIGLLISYFFNKKGKKTK